MSATDLLTPGVAASLSYVRADSKLNRRYVSPGAEMNTGLYEERDVTIRNARLLGQRPTLASHGFELVRHHSAVQDFRDTAETDRVYRPEMEKVILALTGADKVVSFGVTLRDVNNPSATAQPAGTDVHVDFTPRRGLSAARSMLAQAGDPDFEYSRFEAINLWRALSPAPQDVPLAVCDGRSVGDDEGLANTMIRVPELPRIEDIPAELAPEESVMEASLFPYRAEHRWYYYPDMALDELLLFRLFDSRQTGAWRTPHAAFVDRSATDPVPRFSIEARTMVYYR
jgi:hypothetical protein